MRKLYGSQRLSQLAVMAFFAAIGVAIYWRSTRNAQQSAAPSHGQAPATAPATTRTAPPPSTALSPVSGGAFAAVISGPHADRAVALADAQVKAAPDDPQGYTRLAAAFARKFRETADAGYLSRAEAACLRAQKLAPDDSESRQILASIYNSQHRFREAIAISEKGIAENKAIAFNYGTLGDARLELGDYEGAIDIIDRMARMQPDAWAYCRVARLRELIGDPDGAIDGMGMAVAASSLTAPEQRAWFRVQRGNMQFNAGDLEDAEPDYRAALEAYPDYYFALSSMGRLRAAQGKFDEAVALYRRSLEIAPKQETVVLLGDLLVHLKRTDEAEQQFELMGAMDKILHANHVEPGYVLPMFYADHDRNLKECLAQAQECAAGRHDIKTLDTLAWCLYKNGKYAEADAAEKEAMRLNTKDALLFFHAGMIRLKLGQTDEAAKALELAIQINPFFDIRHADEARDALRTLKHVPATQP